MQFVDIDNYVMDSTLDPYAAMFDLCQNMETVELFRGLESLFPDTLCFNLRKYTNYYTEWAKATVPTWFIGIHEKGVEFGLVKLHGQWADWSISDNRIRNETTHTAACDAALRNILLRLGKRTDNFVSGGFSTSGEFRTISLGRIPYFESTDELKMKLELLGAKSWCS